MPVNAYVRLVNHSGTLDKKFRVVFPGFRPTTPRNINVEETLTGGISIQRGSDRRQWEMVFRVKQSEDAGYGTMDDLRTFFDYKTPPEVRVKFYDHQGALHEVYIIGDFSEEPQLPKIDSSKNFYFVPVLLIKAESQ